MKLVPTVMLETEEREVMKAALSHRWLIPEIEDDPEFQPRIHFQFDKALSDIFLTENFANQLRGNLGNMVLKARDYGAAPEVLDELMSGIQVLGEGRRLARSLRSITQFINGESERDLLLEKLEEVPEEEYVALSDVAS